MNLRTTLFRHQVPAVEKLLPTRVGGLFMDMGTGKTRTAIELAARRRSRIDRVLWFCPVTLKDTIRHEILKHTDARPADVCVFDDRTNMRNVPPADWYVVGIESLSSSDRVVLTSNELITDRSYVVVDESSYIKGPHARRTERLTAMAECARYRLLLTGTPLSQGVVDLYAQMRFLSPQILGFKSFYSFAANHLEYSSKFPGMITRALRVDQLAAKIAPYVYQVTKEECLDLPAKLCDVRYYGLTDEQRAAYEFAKEQLLLRLADDDIDQYAIFRLFGALQQIISGFWHHRAGYVARGSQRGEWVLERYDHLRLVMLDGVVAGIPADAKVIIWCKYLLSLEDIAAHLVASHGPGCVACYHGDLTERQREAELRRWRHADGARFLLATQATGGHGLTLNEAHYVVFYENGFKYSERAQAEDRCHRLGQAHPVTYVDLVAARTIDERIQQALSDKADVLESFRRQVHQVRGQRGELQKLAAEL